MNQIKQVQVPDMGDFQDVEIIEVHIQAGDRIESENPLITLESDKATMDVPAPFSGKVENVLIKVGDKVSEGTPIVDLQTSDDAKAEEISNTDEKRDSQNLEIQTFFVLLVILFFLFLIYLLIFLYCLYLFVYFWLVLRDFLQHYSQLIGCF